MGHEDHIQGLLRRAAELGPGPEAAALKRDAALLLDDHDPRGLTLLREAFAEDPEDTGHDLAALAAATESWSLLVEVSEQRLERARDVTEKIEQLEWLAMYQEELLDDRAAAAASWRRVLELDPGRGTARRSLERLSRAEVLAEAPRADRPDPELKARMIAGSPFRGLVPRRAPPPAAPQAPSPEVSAPPPRKVGPRVVVVLAVVAAVGLAAILWLAR